MKHFGYGLLFIVWSAQALTTDAEGEKGIGDTLPIREYTLRVDKLGIEDTPNYASDKATVSLFEYGKKVANLYPGMRIYPTGSESQATHEVGLYSTATSDVYVLLSASTRDGKKAIIQVFYNPLTAWVWN